MDTNAGQGRMCGVVVELLSDGPADDLTSVRDLGSMLKEYDLDTQEEYTDDRMVL
jgi:hypothetical protein